MIRLEPAMVHSPLIREHQQLDGNECVKQIRQKLSDLYTYLKQQKRVIQSVIILAVLVLRIHEIEQKPAHNRQVLQNEACERERAELDFGLFSRGASCMHLEEIVGAETRQDTHQQHVQDEPEALTLPTIAHLESFTAFISLVPIEVQVQDHVDCDHNH